MNNGFADFVEACEKDSGLYNYLKDKGANIRPTIYVLGLTVIYWVENMSLGKYYGKLRRILKDFDNLSHLRNKSIIAHGYEGVSKIDIENVINKTVDKFMEELKQTLIQLNISVKDTSPVEEVREFLKNELNL